MRSAPPELRHLTDDLRPFFIPALAVVEVADGLGIHRSLVQTGAVAWIGINFPDHRERAIAFGETLGVFRDYPASKGCTSSFAPIWINEMVSRQK